MPAEARGAMAMLEARLQAATALLARARGELAQQGHADLRELVPLLEEIAQGLAALPAPAARPLRPRLIGLLDDAGALTTALAEGRAQLVRELRVAGAQRRAGAAYRGPGRT